jgi:DnaJ-class molecular chaperone
MDRSKPGLNSVFTEFFGKETYNDSQTTNKNNTTNNSNNKGKSTVKSVYVTLEELLTGVTKKMLVTRTRVQNGHTVVPTTKLLELIIKPGWKQGTKITFEGEGLSAHLLVCLFICLFVCFVYVQPMDR